MSEKRMVEIPVVRLEQQNLVLYQGKMKARELLELWDIKTFKEEYLTGESAPSGYQREAEDRAKQISTYVRECQVPLIPSLLLAVKGPEFEEFEHSIGVLKIPRKAKAITVIDGQHRGLGFDAIRQSIMERKRLFPTVTKGKGKKLEDEGVAELEKLLDFELPVTFVDSDGAAKIVSGMIDKSVVERELHQSALTPDDVERVFFFVINKTQKSVNPSLKDVLMYTIAAAGINGIPTIAKAQWRTEAVPVVRDLHFQKGSPLFGLINLVGRRGAQQPVRLNTFVSSLGPLFTKNEAFAKMDREKQLEYLKGYWAVIKTMYPRAFREDLVGDYLVLRSLSVYVLNRLANDVFEWNREDGIVAPSEDQIRKLLRPLEDFDWSRERSPIAAYGGQKGVDEAYKLLLSKLVKGGVKKANRQLEPLMSFSG
jgi:hypothetical protein